MRFEFQALLLMIPFILMTAITFDGNKHLAKVVMGENMQLDQLLSNIRQAQLGIIKSITDNQNSVPTNHTLSHSMTEDEKISNSHIVNTTERNVSFVNVLFLPSFNYTKVKAAVASIQNNHTDAARKTLRSIHALLIEQMQRDMPLDAKSPFDLALFLNKTTFNGNWHVALNFIMSLFAQQNETRMDDFFHAMLE